jgi:taurine dioxygenase
MNYEPRRAGIDIVPLDAPLGAEIKGLDLSQLLSDQTIAAIEAAVYEHIVLVVRDQKLSEIQQTGLCSRFGDLYTNPNGGKIRMVSNQMEHYAGEKSQLHDTEMYFHHDTIFRAVPQKILCMHGLEIPTWGGNTIFTNMRLAYEELPAALKARIRGLTAFHAFAYTKTERIDMDAAMKTAHAEHPVAIIHPATGRPVLYLDRLMTLKINGMSEDESDALIAELCDHAEQPKFRYEHLWRAGDVILWDNIASMHARTEMPKDQRRVIRHCSVLGEIAPAAA